MSRINNINNINNNINNNSINNIWLRLLKCVVVILSLVISTNSDVIVSKEKIFLNNNKFFNNFEANNLVRNNNSNDISHQIQLNHNSSNDNNNNININNHDVINSNINNDNDISANDKELLRSIKRRSIDSSAMRRPPSISKQASIGSVSKQTSIGSVSKQAGIGSVSKQTKIGSVSKQTSTGWKQQQQQSTNGNNQSVDSWYMQSDEPDSNAKPKDCIYPCQCSPELPTCQTGVQLIQDGCGCCQICARQQGDLCSKADGCDKSKGLYCNYTQDNGIRGICRAKAGRSCNVNGKIITDGQQYNPSCSLTCFCQDGRYACSTMCPQELHPPSNDHCRDAQLVSIKDRCCKEWVCPHPHNLINLDDALPGHYSNGKSCKHEETEWSACSTTCGYGESVRMSNNNELCQATQERRVCNVRPCEMMVSEISEQSDKQQHRSKSKSNYDNAGTAATTTTHNSNNNSNSSKRKYNKNNPTSNATNDSKCKSTLESPISEKLRYANCESVDEYRLKFCGRCRKCCGPEKTRTVDIKYICPDGSTKTEPFMMIEKCVCHNKPNCSF